MEKVIFGIAGEMFSGKTTASEFLVERFSARHLRFSKILDKLLEVLDLPIIPENEHKLGATLKDLYGDGVLAHALMESLEHSEKNIYVFDDIRKIEELNELNSHGDVKLIYIHATFESRLKRLQEKEIKEGRIAPTEADLKQMQSNQVDAEVKALEQFSDFIIENNGTLEELRTELTKCIIQGL
jgi:dephospho-CoA kinase